MVQFLYSQVLESNSDNEEGFQGFEVAPVIDRETPPLSSEGSNSSDEEFHSANSSPQNALVQTVSSILIFSPLSKHFTKSEIDVVVYI